MATRTAATGSSHAYSHPCQPHSPSHTLSRSSHSHRAPKANNSSTTPLMSPRYPYSVGQSHPPPKLSPSTAAREARSSSPNYFGLVVENSGDPRETSTPAKNNWSPPSSSIKSFGAAIPAQVPLEANPEFEAFRRQADSNRGKSFSLPSASHVLHLPTGAPPARPRPSRWRTHTGESVTDFRHNHHRHNNDGSSMAGQRSSSNMDVDRDSFHDSAYVSAESKRNSESSLLPMQLNLPPTRFESPLPMDRPAPRSTLTRAEDRDPRLSIMEHRADPPSPPHTFGELARAATLPVSLEDDAPSMISATQLRDMVKQVGQDRLLLLDIRSAQNHATSRIKGSLNLCIPTTLLKRAAFNIQRLRQTFQVGGDSEKFARWREAVAIVVYDAHSSDRRDAVTAQNMIKKFTNEGYSGKTCILKGGFADFAATYPDMVDHGPLSDAAGSAKSSDRNDPPRAIAPVIGGMALPSSTGGSNPFFSNIRQNMDLADGVGQFKIDRPRDLESPRLPTWLREAASEKDQGKKVSDKFLKIEMDEKARMQSAFAAFDPNTAQNPNSVQLCGVEKGGKNRYKDILPFEHARVKLACGSDNTCDYVNASHVRPSGSNKRYIATQGPLPATYEDFWSMIWEQDVRVIVMLTAESEGGQLKCHRYWKERQHGAIRLKQLSEKKASLDMDKHRSDSTASGDAAGETKRRRANTTTTVESSTTGTPTPPSSTADQQGEAPYVIIRKFALFHASHPFEPMREITHLHFSSWPDFGTPAQPSHLLGLVELANVMQRAAMPVETNSVMGARSPTAGIWYDEPESDDKVKRPMLVHCSAGCGRTGTFCTVDSVIDMLKRQRQAKNTQAAAKASAGIQTHTDGDVVMGNSGEDDGDISPKTSKPKMDMDGFFNNPETKATKHISQTRNSPGLDTSWVNDEKVDLIQKTVEDFRQQRLSMVQSLRQFVLCYETVLEWENRMNSAGGMSLPNRRVRSGSLIHPRRDL